MYIVREGWVGELNTLSKHSINWTTLLAHRVTFLWPVTQFFPPSEPSSSFWLAGSHQLEFTSSKKPVWGDVTLRSQSHWLLQLEGWSSPIDPIGQLFSTFCPRYVEGGGGLPCPFEHAQHNPSLSLPDPVNGNSRPSCGIKKCLETMWRNSLKDKTASGGETLCWGVDLNFGC